VDHERRKIDIQDLPKATETDLNDGDVLDSAETSAVVKGGIRKGQATGIRPVKPITRISGSSGDPGI